MMNKKLIALLIALATAGVISADYGDCYIGRDGYRHCKSIVGGTTQEAGNVVGKTGRFVGNLFGERNANVEPREQEVREEVGEGEGRRGYYTKERYGN